MTWLYVALGAALGAPVRYLLGRGLDREGRPPWGTVLANVAGSFLLGLVSVVGLSTSALAFLGAGLCGGLTTYSSFAVQSAERGPRLGAVTVLLTVPPALAACTLGYFFGRALGAG